MWTKFGDDWSKTTTCIATQTDKQTDKQTDEKAIGDCVLAKISKMMITRNIMTTTIMIEEILKSI